LLSRAWEIKPKCMYCEANFCMDWLAKTTVGMEWGVEFLQQGPSSLLRLLRADYCWGEGVARSRLISVQS
ncbi:hypothetical protein Ancab_013011, partial [Ancistrocladus abbreviatus]